MWQKAKRFFCFRPRGQTRFHPLPPTGISRAACHVHASTHLPRTCNVRDTLQRWLALKATPFSPSSSHLEQLVPPCSLYPAIDWTATSRSCCRHPCLSSQSLLIAFSAHALGPIWLARKAVRRRFNAKKNEIPKKKVPLVCPPLFPQHFLSRHVLPLPRLLLN